MVVGETIERGRRAHGVGTHIFKVQPIALIQRGVELDALGDAVDAIAGRSPDAVLDCIGIRGGRSGFRIEEETLSGAKDLGNRMLMVEHDAAEVAVHSIIDVEHVAGPVGVRLLLANDSAGNDVACEGEDRRGIVTAGLSDEVDSRVRGEIIIESVTEHSSHVLEAGVAAETAANIQRLEVKTISGSLLKDPVGILDGLEERLGIRGA